MTNTSGSQVANQQEDTQVAFIQSVVAFLQDATNLPKLRQEVEGLRAEAMTLKQANEDLKIELGLEREAHAKTLDGHRLTRSELNSTTAKLSSLQHKFDTINGVVMAAMAEIERDKPKGEFKPSYGVEAKQEEPKPWTPSLPEPNRSSHYS